MSAKVTAGPARGGGTDRQKPLNGLPTGAQIIGPLYEDDTALTFAELLAEHIGGYEPPPL